MYWKNIFKIKMIIVHEELSKSLVEKKMERKKTEK